MRWIIAVGLAAGTLMLGAAAPSETASLLFEKGYTGMKTGRNAGIAWYKIRQKPDCKITRQRVLNWASFTEFRYKAPAGRPIFLEGYSELLDIHMEGLRGTETRAYCRSFVGFFPKAGAEYQVVHQVTPQGCHLQVIDNATGKPPPDLGRFGAVDACLGFMTRTAPLSPTAEAT